MPKQIVNTRTPEEWQQVYRNLARSAADKSDPQHAEWAKGTLKIVKRRMRELGIPFPE